MPPITIAAQIKNANPVPAKKKLFQAITPKIINPHPRQYFFRLDNIFSLILYKSQSYYKNHETLFEF